MCSANGVQERAADRRHARGRHRDARRSIQQDAKKIGITFTVRTIKGAYPTIQTPSKNVPIAERPGWGKDYADALTFFSPLFDGRTIIPTGNTNYSLVGITPAQCKKLKVTGNCNERAERRHADSTSARR